MVLFACSINTVLLQCRNTRMRLAAHAHVPFVSCPFCVCNHTHPLQRLFLRVRACPHPRAAQGASGVDRSGCRSRRRKRIAGSVLARRTKAQRGPLAGPALAQAGGTACRAKNVEDEGEESVRQKGSCAVTARSRFRASGVARHAGPQGGPGCGALLHTQEKGCGKRARIKPDGRVRLALLRVFPGGIHWCVPRVPDAHACRRICPPAARCAAGETEAPGD